MQSRDEGRSDAPQLPDLQRQANKEFPGISDLLAVYGGYEQMVREVEQYLLMMQPETLTSTSSSSSPS